MFFEDSFTRVSSMSCETCMHKCLSNSLLALSLHEKCPINCNNSDDHACRHIDSQTFSWKMHLKGLKGHVNVWGWNREVE